MASAQKSNRANADRRSKAQLMEALEDAEALLQDYEQELSECKKELKRWREKPEIPPEFEEQLKSARAGREQAQAAVNELEAEVTELRADKKKLQDANADKATRLQSAQEEISRRQQKQLALEKKIYELEMRASQADSRETMVAMNSEPAPVAAVQAAAAAEVQTAGSDHPGKPEPVVPEATEAEVSPAEDEPEQMEQPAPQPAVATTPARPAATVPAQTISSLIEAVSVEPGSQVAQSQPFFVDIDLAAGSAKTLAEQGLRYSIAVLARPLTGGAKQVVAELSENLGESDRIVVEASAGILTAGAYKLETLVRFFSADHQPIPGASFHEQGLLHVY